MQKGCVWGVVVCLIMGGSALAQQSSPKNYPARMTIVVPEVEVRSGPTKQYYPTSKLRQGDQVVVLRESKDQPGWLAIQPPPGSFSWIKGKYIKQVDVHQGYVEAEGNATVPVMPGSSVVDQTPNVESVKVPSGSLVVILGQPHQAEGETWLPITPPPTEVRFIPAEAVRFPSTGVVAVSTGFPTNVVVGNNLIEQGDKYYQAGNVELAKQFYRQAAEKATSQEQRNFALNRLSSLPSSSTVPGWQPGAGNQSGNMVPGQVASTTTVNQRPEWSGWGILRQTSFTREGQPVFVLENRQGQALIYAIAQQGTSLRNYVGQLVCLFGPTTYQGGDVPRFHYLVASHVSVP